MGNQQNQPAHPPSYYSVEYLSGSTGTSVPDIILNREYSTSSSSSMIEQSYQEENHETHDETLSTITQPKISNNKMCTIQRSKSYVKPENKVLPGEMPTKPLRKTNYLQTDGHKRTWRHKTDKKNGGKKFSPDCSHLSMPEIYNMETFGKTRLNRNDSGSSGDWKRPSSIAAIRDQRHIMHNEIKNFRDKYSRSMDNLEEWTADEKLPYDIKTECNGVNKHSEKSNNGFFKNNFSGHKKSNNKSNYIDAEKKGKGYKIDPIKVQPLTCTPKEKIIVKRHFLSRPPHLSSTPTNLDRDDELSFVKKESKQLDKSSGILVKKNKSSGNKEIRKSVDFCFEKELEDEKSFLSKTSNKTMDKKSSNVQQKGNNFIEDKKNIKINKSSSQTNNKLDIASKAKAILLESKRRQLMEQSINESLDLPEDFICKNEKGTIKTGKQKSKSFLCHDANKSKSDSIKSKFGIRSIRQRKKEDRVKIIDLEKDIQIISRFPINSKVYRHYIGSASDKLSNSYNATKMVQNEDKLLSQSFISLDSNSNNMNERGIDVTYDENDFKIKVNENNKLNEKKTVIESLNQVFDPIYDSIDDYQSNRNQKIKVQLVKPEKQQPKNSNLYENIQNNNNNNNNNSKAQETYSSFLKSTTSFKPIAKVNPTTTNLNIVQNAKSNQTNALNKIRTKKEENHNRSTNNNNNNNKNIVQVVIPNISLTTNENTSNNLQSIISKFDSLQTNEFHFTSAEENNLNTKNDALRINSHVNRKYSMSSDKLEPIFEGTPNKVVSLGENNNNNKVRRKSTIEITNNQRLNEKLQDEIQKAYEERTKRFNQVKLALRSNSILSNSSYSQIFPTSRPSSQLSQSPCNQDFRIKFTNKMNEREVQPHITTINIASPLPSPPILPPNMHKLQYSVSSCSSVTLPPPPPPPILMQQFNYESIIINESKHSNANTKDDDKKNELSNLFSKIHKKPQEQQNALNRSSIGTTTSSLSSSPTNSSTTSSSSSSLSSEDLTSDKYYSTVDKKKIENETLLLNKTNNSHKQIQNIFDICANELENMDHNFTCKHKNSKMEQDNFILKSRPSTEYTCSNKSFQANHNDYEKTNLYKKENNSEPIKSLPKNRRKALEEVFPDLKPAIQEAQKHVQIFNTSQCIDNESDEEYDNNYKDNIQFKAVQNNIDKFQINDPDWCPASDLGDFDLDDFETKTTCDINPNSTSFEDSRPKKKTKHSTSFLIQTKPDIKDDLKPNIMIAKPIPVHIKSTQRQINSDNQAPIFSKIQTKLSSFENTSNKSNNKNFIPCNLSGDGVNRIISNTCTFDNSIDNIKKWNTVDSNEANLKMKSDINPTKCKFEIVLFPFKNNNNDSNWNKLNNNNNNINSIAQDNYIEQSTDNDYDFLHCVDESTTITDTTIKHVSSNNISILSQNNNTQSNYRTLIKMKDQVTNNTSSDDETMNAVIREQNRKTCANRANSIIKDKKTFKLGENNIKVQNRITSNNDSHNELDSILYETDRKSIVSDGKFNPIYYSSSNESIYSNLM